MRCEASCTKDYTVCDKENKIKLLTPFYSMLVYLLQSKSINIVLVPDPYLRKAGAYRCLLELVSALGALKD